MAEQLPPEQCPDPSYHDTFRYCPHCSWTEPTCAVESADGLLCSLYRGHDGPHEATVKWSA